MRWSSLPPMSSSSNRGQAKCSSAIFDHRLLMPGSPHITGERERLIRPRCRCHGLQRAACGDGPGGKSASSRPMHNTDGPFSRPSADAGAEGHQVPAGAMVHGGRQQPEAIRGAGLPSGVLSTGRGGHSLFRAAFTMRLPVAIQAHEAGTDLTVLYGTTFAETTNFFFFTFQILYIPQF